MTPSARSSSSLRETAAKAAATTAGDGDTIFDLIKKMRPEVEKALPAGVGPDRLIRVTLTEVRRTPQLQECSAPSVLGALMQAAQLGLEPGPLGVAYLVPFWNNKLKTRECQLIIGYRGIVDLARRGGANISAHAVHEADTFEVEYGLEDRLVHRPNLREDRGDVWAYYAVGRHADGGHNFEVLTRTEVEAHAERFGNNSSESPWTTDFDAMALKTAVRQLARWLPLSVDARDAIASDGATFRFDKSGVELVTPAVDAIAATALEEPDTDPENTTEEVASDE